jgi:membrane protein YdbS with pleckstrin-like domain
MAEMSTVNKPEVSGPLAWFYIATAVLLAALGALFTYLYVQTQEVGVIVGLIAVIVVEMIVISIVVSMYRTEYTFTA